MKNNRLEARISFEAKEGLLKKAKACNMNLSEFLEVVGKKPFSFFEDVRQSFIKVEINQDG